MPFDVTKLTFKRATISDIEILIDSRIRFLKETQGEFPHLEKALRESTRHYFIRAINNNVFIGWIALYEHKPVSFGSMVIHEQPGHFHAPSGKNGYILGMYTIPEFREKGINGEILKRLIDEAKKRRLGKIELHATKESEKAYRNQGFKEPKEIPLELNLTIH